MARTLERMFRLLMPKIGICYFNYHKKGRARGWWVTYTYYTPDGNYIARSRRIGRTSREAAKRIAVAYARTQGIRPSNSGAEASNV